MIISKSSWLKPSYHFRLHSHIIHRLLADVAQLVERILGKNEVLGSIPNVGSKQLTIEYMLRYSSGQRGQTVNLLLYGYIGSNPILSTLLILKD